MIQQEQIAGLLETICCSFVNKVDYFLSYL